MIWSYQCKNKTNGIQYISIQSCDIANMMTEEEEKRIVKQSLQSKKQIAREEYNNVSSMYMLDNTL